MILEAFNMEQKVLIIGSILFVAKKIFEYFLKKNEDSEVLLEILDWIKTALSALLIAFLIMYFIIQAFKIPSGSMMNTLLIKDNLFVNKFIYGTRLPILKKEDGEIKLHMKRFFNKRNPTRREIVVFAFPEDTSKDFVKRCIGLPGDKIEIKDKVLYVNDVKQEEQYVIHSDSYIYPAGLDFLPEHLKNRDNFGPVIVPKDYYFMLGDNRDQSYDSRFWGFLHKDYIKGKPILIYWPRKRFGMIK